MQLSSFFLALSAVLSSAFAQQSYGDGLGNALDQGGASTVKNAFQASPPTMVQGLQQGSHTLYAPTDSAVNSARRDNFGAFGPNLTQALQYHITQVKVDTDALTQGPTVVKSTLSDPPTVLLPNGDPQVLLNSKKDDGTVILDNARRTVSVTNAVTYENIQILFIDHILAIPDILCNVIDSTPELKCLRDIIKQRLPDFINSLSGTPGVTLFLPINEAVTAVKDALNGVDDGTLNSILLNHVITGTALYSPSITDGLSFTGAGGQTIKFTTDSNGITVCAGGSSARIVVANILTANGVIHLIDNVLFDTASNNNNGHYLASTTGGAVSSLQVDLPSKLLSTVLAGAFLGATVL